MSPIAGYGHDIIIEYEMVLVDGSVVKVSEDENEDLYWANRGGGGGIGVITSLTFKVLQNPRPGAFTFLVGITNPEGKLGEWWVRFQDFLFDHPESYRFGGSTSPAGHSLVCLGPTEECVEILTDAGLLDEDLLDPTIPTMAIKDDGSVLCQSGDCSAPLPPYGIGLVRQFRTNGETQAYITCQAWLAGFWPWQTARTLDVCADLGVDGSYCECVVDAPVGPPCSWKSPTWLTCSEPEVIIAILQAASDPTSFFSRHGLDVTAPLVGTILPLGGLPESGGRVAGGHVLPRLEAKTIRALADLAALGVNVPLGNHLVHGASHYVPEDATAQP